ncbi:hypothetical protein [Nonomuraea sp. NPDC049784]|uniref:hypothetical protein n=1 Tax=Nonomuraea sp. NPDC049784 TaxID=3154361 RepID=UPI003408DA72
MDVIELIIAGLLGVILLVGYITVLIGIRREDKALNLRRPLTTPRPCWLGRLPAATSEPEFSSPAIPIEAQAQPALLKKKCLSEAKACRSRGPGSTGRTAEPRARSAHSR